MLTILRAMYAFASGSFEQSFSEAVLNVSADIDEGVIQSPFMVKIHRLKFYQQQLKVSSDELSYSQRMILDIYGRV